MCSFYIECINMFIYFVFLGHYFVLCVCVCVVNPCICCYSWLKAFIMILEEQKAFFSGDFSLSDSIYSLFIYFETSKQSFFLVNV
jgi:hypothetical protein